jgi:2-iminobutanoate/2-iminopropanoate deaminase
VTTPIYHLIPNAPKPVAPYSHVVEADGWLFVTGQLATDPDDDSLPLTEGIEAQTRKVMDNLKRALAGVGAGYEHVVCVRIFLTNFERDYAALNRIYTEYFEQPPPKRRDGLCARRSAPVHLGRCPYAWRQDRDHVKSAAERRRPRERYAGGIACGGIPGRRAGRSHPCQEHGRRSRLVAHARDSSTRTISSV